jgi:hypothetical protein
VIETSRIAKVRSVSASLWIAPSLLCLDPELLDERPPFFDIGLLQCVESFRCLSLTWENICSNFNVSRTHCRIGQCLHGRSIEPGDDLLRRVLFPGGSLDQSYCGSHCI